MAQRPEAEYDQLSSEEEQQVQQPPQVVQEYQSKAEF